MNYFDIFLNKNKIIPKISYENIQDIINNNNNDDICIINTLNNDLQKVLIKYTIKSYEEEDIINKYISNYNYKQIIIIYGSNDCDESVIKKYLQLEKYGFINLFIYNGGLFEWLLLQDIYGKKMFPTTEYTLDILKYKPIKKELKKN